MGSSVSGIETLGAGVVAVSGPESGGFTAGEVDGVLAVRAEPGAGAVTPGITSNGRRGAGVGASAAASASAGGRSAGDVSGGPESWARPTPAANITIPNAPRPTLRSMIVPPS
jgi:hypothetical protein